LKFIVANKRPNSTLPYLLEIRVAISASLSNSLRIESFARPTAMASQLLPRQKNRGGCFLKVVNFEQTATAN
jgi:hypothetical protein